MRLQKEAVWKKPLQLNMEGALIARDRVGVQDFVLLDSHTSESAFLDNLRKRYRENLIYVIKNEAASPFATGLLLSPGWVWKEGARVMLDQTC